MMKNAKQFRMESKNALSGKWGLAVAVSFVFGLLFACSTATLLGSIILGGVLMVGNAIAFTQLFRTGELKFENLFAGFSTNNFTATIGLYVKTTLYTFFWSLLFFIPGIVKAYSYAMAPYILADNPELTGGEALTASREMMRGKKWRLFCLDFSFIGWEILSIFTLGILTLWITPWKAAAIADFYETVKTED